MSEYTQKALLADIMEEALDQPNPTKGLKRVLDNYSSYVSNKAKTRRAKNAACQKRHRAEVLAISSGYAEGGLGGTPFGV